MRKLALIVVGWMALMGVIALVVHSGHSGPKVVASPTSSVAPAGPKKSRNAASEAPPSVTPVAPAPAYLPPSQSQGQGQSGPPAANADEQQRLSLATSGWPAVAKMPWSAHGVRVDEVGVAAGKVVLNVEYHGAKAQAVKLTDAFLRRSGDLPDNYRLRLISPAAQAQSKRNGTAFSLALAGHQAVAYLPQSHGRTTLSFTGVHGKQVVLEARYRGSLSAAHHDVAWLFRQLHDQASHYVIRYQKG